MRRLLRAALPAFLAAGLLVTGSPATAESSAQPASPAGSTQPAAVDDASTFTALSPVRVLDTRTAGGGSGPPGPGQTISVDLSAHVPATATAVVLNVTGVTPTSATHVTVFPSGGAAPNTSSLNLVAGEIRANQVTVALGAGRKVSLYNNSGVTHLVADLAGHYGTGTGAKFTPLPANRVMDTRWNGSPVGPGESRVVDLNGRVPASATAVTFNLTVTDVTASTVVTAWPAGTPRPNTSNVNLTAGETRPNLVTVALGADRKVSLHNLAGSVHLVVDFAGFYTPDYGASFVPMSPTRVLDTRFGPGPTGPVGPDAEIEADLGNLPPTTTGVVLNLTGVDATTATHVTAWGPYRFRPSASNLNVTAGQTAPNAAVVTLAQRPAVVLHNNSGSIHLVGDLTGVFAVVDTPCTAGCVHAWGDGDVDRELGTAELELPFRPVTPKPVVSLSGVRAVAGGGGNNGYALRTDGTVVAWGNNAFGQLGDGWVSNEASPSWGGGSAVPVPVRGLTGVTAIAAHDWGAYALRSDGTVWAWGYGMTGRLGNGQTGNAAVPVRVTGLTGVVAIASGWGTGYALRQDGTVMAWGTGALGNGSHGTAALTPVQVDITGVTAIASGYGTAYAVREDGTVWAWGVNYEGELGNGQPCAPAATCVATAPVQVSGLAGMTSVAAGGNTFAVREDGTVWAWGRGYNGALGNGVECDPAASPCESRVPVRVADLTDVTQVAAFGFGGYALRANGTVWAWGSNLYHSLGTNQVPNYTTVPVRVQTLTGVATIGGGWLHGYAVVP